MPYLKEVFDSSGAIHYGDGLGIEFKYLCKHENLKTGKKSEFKKTALFFSRAAFMSCIKKWTKQGRTHGIHLWAYLPI